jgi:hypothetical protein
MILNQKSWELVKEGNFIVGDTALLHNGVTYHPGDDFPKETVKHAYALYETNRITEKVVVTEPEGKPKSKRKK